MTVRAFAAFYYLNLCAANIFHLICESFAGITRVHQKLLHMRKIVQVKENHLDGSIPVSHIGGCYGYGMGQSHRINYNVTFDS